MSECAGSVQGDDFLHEFIVDACENAVFEQGCVTVTVVVFADVDFFLRDPLT